MLIRLPRGDRGPAALQQREELLLEPGSLLALERVVPLEPGMGKSARNRLWAEREPGTGGLGGPLAVAERWVAPPGVEAGE